MRIFGIILGLCLLFLVSLYCYEVYKNIESNNIEETDPVWSSQEESYCKYYEYNVINTFERDSTGLWVNYIDTIPIDTIIQLKQ